MAFTKEEKRKQRTIRRVARVAMCAANGLSPHPRHRPPTGKVWDAKSGSWESKCEFGQSPLEAAKAAIHAINSLLTSSTSRKHATRLQLIATAQELLRHSCIARAAGANVGMEAKRLAVAHSNSYQCVVQLQAARSAAQQSHLSLFRCHGICEPLTHHNSGSDTCMPARRCKLTAAMFRYRHTARLRMGHSYCGHHHSQATSTQPDTVATPETATNNTGNDLALRRCHGTCTSAMFEHKASKRLRYGELFCEYHHMQYGMPAALSAEPSELPSP